MEKLHAVVNENKFSMKNVVMEVAEFCAQVSRLREEVSKADLICYEETTTNEEAIKDSGRSVEPDTGIPIVMDLVRGRLSYTTDAFQSQGHRKSYNRNQVGGTNIFGSLQVIQMVAPRDSSRKPQPTSPKWYAFLTTSLGKWWKSIWSVILDSDQRFCPTLVQAGKKITLEDHENALHQIDGKA